jgi:hypothetical protein
MRGWLRSNQKTKANPRVVAPLVFGRRSFTSKDDCDGELRQKRNYGLPTLRGCNKHMERCSGSPWCFLGGRGCRLKTEVTASPWFPAKSGGKDPLDSSSSQPPWMHDSSQRLYETRRSYWTTRWSSRCSESMASGWSPAIDSATEERTEGVERERRSF